MKINWIYKSCLIRLNVDTTNALTRALQNLKKYKEWNRYTRASKKIARGTYIHYNDTLFNILWPLVPLVFRILLSTIFSRNWNEMVKQKNSTIESLRKNLYKARGNIIYSNVTQNKIQLWKVRVCNYYFILIPNTAMSFLWNKNSY